MDTELLLHLLFSLLLATGLAALALWRKALTPGGLALAWSLAVVIAYCGGLPGFLALAATFVFTILAGKLSKPVREPLEQQKHVKTGQRDAMQIFCNVFTGALMLSLYAGTGLRCFLWAYGGAMAASLADSMASELGVLSKQAPVDLCTLRPTERGLSGGVTALGLGASLLGALLIASVCAPFWGGGAGGRLFFALTLSGFLAALFDSFLGSGFQAKYRCPACGSLTEKPVHCKTPGALERGYRFVTNDLVNFFNNLLGAGAAALLWVLLEG